jgi:DNA polymerase-3 subunit beta
LRIRINRESFQRIFQVAAAVVPVRSPKTILQNVKLSVSAAESILSATDMELGVRLTVPDIIIEKPGTAVIPVARLNMILRESGDETLTIDADNERTLITGQFSRFELAAHNPDEYPELTDFKEHNFLRVKSGTFREMIKRTLFATDADSSRFALGGVLLELEGDTMIAVGTDGRRLATMQGAVEKIGTPSIGSTTIVPSRSMQVIERLIPDDESPIDLALRSNDLLLRGTTGVFFSRLVEGRYPKWREVVPKRTADTNQVDIPVGPMYSALRQAAIVASDESRGVDFTFDKGTLVLTNSTAEVGQSRIEMPVPYDNGETTITLDHRFVADFLKVLQPDKTFTFDFEDSEKAAFCHTDDHYGYVIMPLSKERR